MGGGGPNAPNLRLVEVMNVGVGNGISCAVAVT